MLELKLRGILFFVVKGFSKGSSRREALVEAKKPINIPRGFSYKLDYKPSWIIQKSLSYVLKSNRVAIAIPGINNRIMWIDIKNELTDKIGDEILLCFALQSNMNALT